MLHEFIAIHREEIIARTRSMLSGRIAPRPAETEPTYGVPHFLDQLAARLRPEAALDAAEIASSASLHASELRSAGLTLAQVVHDYGNICQAITSLSLDEREQLSGEDYRTLNLCLDIAIAGAVTEYSSQNEQTLISRGVEQLGFLAHELRNLINAASLAFEAVRSGSVGVTGSTSNLVGKSLAGMRDLVSRSLAEVRLESGPPRIESLPVALILEEVELVGAMQAKSLQVQLSIERPEPGLRIDGDPQIIGSILSNLVHNACKFTRPHGRVRLSTRATTERVLIDVEDECGGLPPGALETLFQPYQQRGADRSGLGLGLAISLRGARALGGDLHVRDLPGAGCVFTAELLRSAAA